MKKLIESLQIFLKYKDLDYPTACEHDVMYVHGIEKDEVTSEDQALLAELGWQYDDSIDVWYSFKYGSA